MLGLVYAQAHVCTTVGANSHDGYHHANLGTAAAGSS
jgi:hypothetical protein